MKWEGHPHLVLPLSKASAASHLRSDRHQEGLSYSCYQDPCTCARFNMRHEIRNNMFQHMRTSIFSIAMSANDMSSWEHATTEIRWISNGGRYSENGRCDGWHAILSALTLCRIDIWCCRRCCVALRCDVTILFETYVCCFASGALVDGLLAFLWRRDVTWLCFCSDIHVFVFLCCDVTWCMSCICRLSSCLFLLVHFYMLF